MVLGWWSIGAGVGEALAAPLLAHALVLAEPRDGAVGALSAQRVGFVLAGSGAFRLVDPLFAEARLGRPVAQAVADCHGREACWREVGLAVGAEHLVWVEQIDTTRVGLVVLDLTGEGGMRRDQAALLPGGWPDPRLVERTMLGEGRLRVEALPPRAALRVDGEPVEVARGEQAVEMAWHAGKHAVEVEAPGYRPWHAAVLVPPNGARVVRVELVPDAGPPPRRYAWWAGVALGVAGGLAVGLAGSGPSPAIAAP